MRSLPLAIPLILFASPALAANPQPAAASTPQSKPSEVSAAGFKPPDLKGYEKKATLATDASDRLPGEETTVEVFENKAGDRVMKLSLNGVTWAFGYVPQGDPTKGYVLRDPACAKKLTEKWRPDMPFTAPDCAVSAKAPPAPKPK